MKRLMKKTAGYDFNYDNLNKILDAMSWTGDSDQDSAHFVGTITVEQLKSNFGLSDEDVNNLPNAVKNGDVDFDSLIDDLFSDYISVDFEYTLKDKDVDLKVLNGEFYIEGSASIQHQEEGETNGPTEFNQQDFI